MLLNQLDETLNNLYNAIANQAEERLTVIGAVAMQASMLKRIFERGQATSGAGIASKYSSSPTYYPKKAFKKTAGAFKPIGKNTLIKSTTKTKAANTVSKTTITVSKKNVENKANRKTMYLAGGYKMLRQVQGLQVNFVDLHVSGSLMQSIRIVTVSKEVQIRIVGTDGVMKSENTEKLYKKDIFKPSVQDKQAAENAISDEIALILQKSLS
jgi:hypothetical protein